MIGDLIAESNNSVQNGNKNNTKRLFCGKKNPRSQIDFIDKNIVKNLLLKFSTALTKITKTPTLSQKWHLTHTKLGVKI